MKNNSLFWQHKQMIVCKKQTASPIFTTTTTSEITVLCNCLVRVEVAQIGQSCMDHHLRKCSRATKCIITLTRLYILKKNRIRRDAEDVTRSGQCRQRSIPAITSGVGVHSAGWQRPRLTRCLPHSLFSLLPSSLHWYSPLFNYSKTIFCPA